MKPLTAVLLGLCLLVACSRQEPPPAPVPSASASSAPMAVPDRLKGDVAALVDLGPRDTSRPEALNRAADHLAGRFRQMGLPPARLEFDAGGVQVANLEATVPGTEPGRRGFVVVGAHYDTVPSSPGADDNASGVALLLELASRLKGRPAATPVRFVAFTNEEPPHFMTPTMGSLVYARSLKARDEEVLGMLSLESLGFYSREPGSQKVPEGLQGVFRERGDFVALVSAEAWAPHLDRAAQAFARSSDVPLLALPIPDEVQEGDWSDHWSFAQVGYPAMMATDTALFRNPHYHRGSDTTDTLDFATMAAAVDGLEAAIRALASGGPAGHPDEIRVGPSNAPR